MLEKILTAIFTVLFLGVMVLAVVFGIVTKSAWVGALAFFGVLLSLGNIVIVSSKGEKTTGYFGVHFLALVCFGTAFFLADLQPRWMVVSFVTFAMLPMTFGSENFFKKSKGSGFSHVFLALISAPLAIALPALILNLTQDAQYVTADWAWSFAVGGVITALIALVRATLLETSDYFICSAISLVSLVAGSWLVGDKLGWLWLVPWLTSALSIGTGAFLFPKWKSKAKTIGVILAVLIGLFGVGFTLMNTGVIPNLFHGVSGRELDFEVALERTISALDYSSTQLAATEEAATQAYLDDQEQIALEQTQTVQAKNLSKAQTSTAKAEPTLIPSSTATQNVKEAKVSEQATSAFTLPVLSTNPGPGFIKAIGKFMWAAIKSIWGILYLLLLIGLGQLWIKRWGGAILFIVLIVLVGIFGGSRQGLLDLFTQLVTTGPSTWWTYTLSVFGQSSGTIGWGIIGMAFAVTMLLAPAFLITNRYSQKALSAQRVQELRGTTAAEQFLSRNMPGCKETLATWIFLLVSFAFPISLWVALRRLSAGIMNSLPFWFIPDLTVPHWKPVWHYAYFVLGGVFFLIYVLYIKLMGQFQEGNPFAKIGLWGVFPASILLTLFAPAGVVLYQGVQILLICILLPLVGKAPERKPAVPLRAQPQRSKPIRPTPPKPARYTPPKPKPSPTDFEAYLEEMKRLAKETKAEEAGEEEKKPISPKPRSDAPHLAGEILYTLSVPMVGGYLKSSDSLCVLDESSSLFWLEEGRVRHKTDLSLRNPSQLLTANDDQLIAVTRLGELIPIKADQEWEITPKKNLGKRIKQCAVNSYGTLLAYTSEDAPSRVHGYFIAAERDQLFFDAGQAPVSCLVFSKNARYLAAGTTSGRIMVIDIATHQQVVTIPDKNFGPVEMLAATEDERWISVYSDGWVVIWDMQGTQTEPVELSNGATSMALDKPNSQILIGDRAGYLWVYQKDLKAQNFSLQVQQGNVTHIFTAPDGTIVTVGDGKTLRKVNLK